MTAHSYVGMWVMAEGYIRHELLPNGRYDEARGSRKSAYQGRYRITDNHIDYVDDTGFYRRRRASSCRHDSAAREMTANSGRYLTAHADSSDVPKAPVHAPWADIALRGRPDLARRLKALGHDVRLMPAKYVKPSKGQKNDFKDAEATAEALQQPTMRFVVIKSIEQLDLQALHRPCDRLVSQRTGIINQIRAFMHERGIGSAPSRELSGRVWYEWGPFQWSAPDDHVLPAL